MKMNKHIKHIFKNAFIIYYLFIYVCIIKLKIYSDKNKKPFI